MRGRLDRYSRYVGSIVLVATTVACGDLVNHDDNRPGRAVSITAVYLDGGHPTALLAPCEGTRVSSLTVSDGVNALWAVDDVDPPNPVSTVRFFVAPAGWHRDSTGAKELTSLAPARTHYVFASLFSGSTRPTRDNALTLAVTLGDLTSLRSGEVWAVRAPGAEPGRMTRAQFHAASQQTCGS